MTFRIDIQVYSMVEVQIGSRTWAEGWAGPHFLRYSLHLKVNALQIFPSVAVVIICVQKDASRASLVRISPFHLTGVFLGVI